MALFAKSTMPLAAALAVVTVLGTGCAYRFRFDTGEPRSDVVVKEWRNIYAWGWVDAAPFDLDRACPDGVAQFGSYVSFTNWLPAFFTVGIYTPRTVFAACSERGAAARAEAPTDASADAQTGGTLR